MKKAILGLILLIIASWSVSAQGFYFDVGTGVGICLTSPEEVDLGSIGTYNSPDSMMNLEIKAGYGPFGTIPVYVAVDGGFFIPIGLSGRGGVVFYPTQFLQMGGSFGAFFPLGGTDSVGTAWNISVAVDFGKRNHAYLLGLQYSGAAYQHPHLSSHNTNDTQLVSYLSIFAKYAYRKKVPQQTAAVNVAAEKPQPSPRTPPQPRQDRPQPGIDGAITRASGELINKLPAGTRLAVLNISSNNGEMSAYTVDELEYQLVTSGKFTIVDRNTLEAIRSEQNFQMSGEVSDESAISVGQILGANIVITGSITSAARNQRLSLRVLDVRTAEIVTMVREEF